MFAPKQNIQDNDTYTLVIFDMRIPGVAERLHREHAAWQGHSDIEALDQYHYILIIRPGGAVGLTV